MSNDKQSSIEWLAQQLYEQMEMCGDGDVYDKIIKQAKVLHEQEICKTYISAIKEYMIDPLGDTLYRIDAEEYYNETFGDNNMGGNNGEITTDNIPDTNEGNTSTTGNISNTWGGDTSSITGNINAWSGGHIKNGTIISDRTGTKTEDDNRIAAEKQIWNKTVNWDIMNKYTRANDEEQAPYNVETKVNTKKIMHDCSVSKPNKTDDGTLAVIEITIDIKQR